MYKTAVAKYSRWFSLALAIGVICYICTSALAPFGRSVYADVDNSGLAKFAPDDRVKFKDGAWIQTGDSVYTESTLPLFSDTAKVRLTFKNNSDEQSIRLGFRDQAAWHYKAQTIDAPLINSLEWPRIGDGPYLYQKKQTYKTTEQFLAEPPSEKVIGIFDYDHDAFVQPEISLEGYTPSESPTTINTPLRGRTVLYAYLENEPFNMTISKRDLNWYAGEDNAAVSVYKQSDKVFTTSLEDDGNIRDDRKNGRTQSVTIKNPGPELPEAGVYKIVIDATGDSVITGIKTNLHKIVAQGPLNPISNKSVYTELIKDTIPTKLYTTIGNVQVTAYHEQSLQKVSLGAKNEAITQVKTPIIVTNKIESDEPALLNLPLSDVVVNGIGFFAFEKDQYFLPSPYRILPINQKEDFEQVDFVLTEYIGAPTKNNGWKTIERTFDITEAVTAKNKLSWVLSAPDLKANNRSIEIKDIEMTLSKEGWLKR